MYKLQETIQTKQINLLSKTKRGFIAPFLKHIMLRVEINSNTTAHIFISFNNTT
ncbi:hypothetical protein Marme_1986 [Marinomonas mediterranea MMB-1]|uniref:Uncharacterized protein n=1 Tax=Marinomonas mediterranea (strain ATCC 700492 / JCM 21426 / NBRC 103028 / MMB-1) TaxID=717774 RepID=F2K2V1_MARM1|nr:hypothetical protein Marme_1986 [Marinomonas mediterranea MMB-1]